MNYSATGFMIQTVSQQGAELSSVSSNLISCRCTYVFSFEYDTRGKYENHNLYFVTDPLYTIYRYYPVLFLDLSRGRGGE